MIRVWLLALAVTCAAATAAPREAAPQFTATTLDGQKFTNETLKGKTVLLQFWTTWAKYCPDDQPAVDAIAREFSGRGLVVLAVNVGESREKVKAYLKQSPRACKIVLSGDTNLAAIFAAQSFPRYVLIDKEGKVAGIQDGAGGEDSLRQFLRKAGLATE